MYVFNTKKNELARYFMNNEITKCSKVTIDVRYDAVNHKN